MRLLRFVFAVACILPLSACTKQTGSGTEVADSPVQQDVSANSVGNAAKVESEMDYGEWLQLPEGLSQRLREPYPTLVQSAIAGDPQGLMSLALLSQQIASTLARTDKIDKAYEFILQSGRAVRAGLPEGAEFLPASSIANIYFNEASALARSGKVTEAEAALDDAVSQGFSELSAIAEDPELAPVREREGFAQKMEAWQLEVKRRTEENARRDLKNGKTFPFTFAGKDINGNEQSLEAFKGKVLIVDFWGTWCPPCRAEIPSFVQLQEKYGEQGFQMIGLNYEHDPSYQVNLDRVLEFAQEFSINYPCLLIDQEMMAQVPEFKAFPTTLFIDRSGKVRMTTVGVRDDVYLETVVSALLNESE